MTARETWKASERRMAGILGGERVPVSGRERGHAPDIDGVVVAGRRLAIEHKYGSRLLSSRLVEALDQAEAAKRSPDDIPVVTLEVADAGRLNRRLVLLDAERFMELAGGRADDGASEAVLEGWQRRCLKLGEMAGWPALPFKPGISVASGEALWRLWMTRASVPNMVLVVAALQEFVARYTGTDED